MKLKSTMVCIAALSICIMMQLLTGCNETPITEKDGGKNATSATQMKAIGEQQQIDCEKPPLLTVSLSVGKVDILSYNIDTAANKATFNIMAYENTQSPQNRKLIIEAYATPTTYRCWRATLIDEREHLKWALGCEFDRSDSTHFWVTEKTESDELVIEQKREPHLFTETYTLNGMRRAFAFPTDDVSRIASLRDQVYSYERYNERNLAKYAAQDLEIIGTIEEFNQFNDTSNSLYNNSDAQLVIDLIKSKELASRIYTEHRLEMPHGETMYPETEIPWELICHMVYECIVLKCPFGGFSNIVCVGCSIGVVVCVLVKIL
ncbi:MAG: hypothetical protein NT002_03800 [candidate division Zixibacteria bacterium]|nr:hypothetical protein [candidate division Zixibacteria bacterium]